MLSSLYNSLFGTVLCEKLPVFDSLESEKVCSFFSTQTQDAYFFDGLDRRALHKKSAQSGVSSWTPIAFDSQGKIASGDLTHQYSDYSEYPQLKELTQLAAEKMAAQFEWKNETHEMDVTIVQHVMKEGVSYGPIPRHRDKSRHTMVILLDDERNWKGGEFQYIPDSIFKSQTRLTPQKGYGILFSNAHYEHAVTQLFPKTNTTRTILTIHERGKGEEGAFPTPLSYLIGLISSIFGHLFYYR